MTKHRRPGGGLAQGYYCLNCGAPGMNMYGMSHRAGAVAGETVYKCAPNPAHVAAVRRANEAEKKVTRAKPGT